MGRYVNDAYIQICRETKVLEGIESMATVVGTPEYDLSQNVLQIKRVFLDDTVLPNRTKWERDREYGNWEGQSNGIGAYLTSQQNNRTFRFDQYPTGVKDVDVWHVRLPNVLETECEPPEVPAWIHPAIAFKAAAKALNKYGEMRNPQLAAAYEAIANDYLSLLNRFISNRIGERRV